MPRLTVDLMVSLDGFATGPDRGITRGGPDFLAFLQQALDEPHTIVLGRVTYEEMAPYWPAATGSIAERMNSLPKLVFSRTLAEPLGWANARVATRGLAEEITALKQQPGDPLHCVGSLSIARQLIALDLAERLRLVVFPRILGSAGRQPVFERYPLTRLSLVDTSTLDHDTLLLEYEPTREANNA